MARNVNTATTIMVQFGQTLKIIYREMWPFTVTCRWINLLVNFVLHKVVCELSCQTLPKYHLVKLVSTMLHIVYEVYQAAEETYLYWISTSEPVSKTTARQT